MKRILIIVENEPVPFDIRVWREALALRQGGYSVTVLCPRGGGSGQTHEVIDGVRIYRHPMLASGNGPGGYLWEYGSALFWEFLYAWWIFGRRGFDVIQGCGPPDNIFLVALPFRLFGVKYIFDHHDASPELFVSKFNRRGVMYRLLLWLEKLSFWNSDAVLATNESYRRLAMARGQVAAKDVFIVRNGPDLDTFRVVPPNPQLKRGKSHLVAYVGVMNVQDGLDILLEVASRMKTLGRNDVQFTCVGRGPQLPRLKRVLHDKNLEDMVNFTGYVPDRALLEVLSTADICVNPDRPCEMNDISTMVKIMEYMAVGKPIVQFESKEGKYSAQEASLYSDPREPVEDFANKLVWLLDHPEERKRMGKLGQDRVENELAWKYSVPHLLAAYRKVLNERAS